MSEEFFKTMKEKDVQYVDLRFTDVRGKLQHVTFTADAVDEAMFEEPGPAGDVIRGSFLGRRKCTNARSWGSESEVSISSLDRSRACGAR